MIFGTPTEDELTPVIFAEAVPPFGADGKRCPVMFHVRRVGRVFFVEQLNVRGEWRVVCTSKPDAKTDMVKASFEAIVWMVEAHAQFYKLSATGQRSA